jgi:hypothetical protein
LQKQFVEFVCQACGKRGKARVALIGESRRCPTCQQITVITSAAPLHHDESQRLVEPQAPSSAASAPVDPAELEPELEEIVEPVAECSAAPPPRRTDLREPPEEEPELAEEENDLDPAEEEYDLNLAEEEDDRDLAEEEYDQQTLDAVQQRLSKTERQRDAKVKPREETDSPEGS